MKHYSHRTLLPFWGKVIVTSLIIIMNIGICAAQSAGLKIHYLGANHSLVQVREPQKYLLLPVEEAAPEATINVLVNNKTDRSFQVRLAVNRIDYLVPFDLEQYKGKTVTFDIHTGNSRANVRDAMADACWKELKLSDTFDDANREEFRPLYHHSPLYGWMNDPNGMFYKDGEYHLYYQWNPYGSMWGNMNWGHSSSKDLISWQHHPVAIQPNGLGTVFSGSSVVDKDNTAGFGAGAIVAFYTSASDRQVQSMAYSLDNGRTFKKYDRNPILTSTQRDFRDPKVFWHKESNKWIMVLAVGQEMQLYSSPNLKDWTYESSFGEGQGAHAGVWECPDLIELPVKGTELKKWVLICNINPGGPFGGSATQYFVGTFDGKQFVNESPALTKWMDYGKDHYATVTWSNAPEDRKIALAWMSNWEYANNVPTSQYRSANSVPRDLALYTKNGQTYLSSTPSPEVLKLRGKAQKKGSFKVDRSHEVNPILSDHTGTYEIEIKFKNNGADIMSFQLFNSKGEEVEMYYNLLDNTFTMDRRNSGATDFSKTFATATSAPISAAKEYTLRLLVDNCSIEAFDGNGEFVMTNLVFPEEPYNRISFNAKGGAFTVTSLTIYPFK